MKFRKVPQNTATPYYEDQSINTVRENKNNHFGVKSVLHTRAAQHVLRKVFLYLIHNQWGNICNFLCG
jgi:hypothetical protein